MASRPSPPPTSSSSTAARCAATSPATTRSTSSKRAPAKYQTFLTLGFGGSGKELANAWTITDQGPETIAGTRTEKLDLVGKTDDIKNLFTHVTIWVDPTRSISLRQIFYTSNGDNRTADYTNIKLNAHVDTKPYDIPKGAKSINR
jgi:outer membrane lipoprotein-sorting protein